MMNALYFDLALLVLLPGCFSFFDPITIGLGAGLGMGLYKWDFVKRNTYCRYVECCDEQNTFTNAFELKSKLEQHLYGQHIVLEQIIPALRAHLSPSSPARKPLVMSFHGTPGTGKNYVAQLIAESLFKKGLESKFVHKFMGRSDFPIAEHASIYKHRINEKVRSGIKDCSRSLFIFDEVDKMPPGVFESLTSLLEYNVLLSGKSTTQAIFLFLSNTAGVQISERLASLLKAGTMREETRLSHFEQSLEKAAYNLEGGFKKTSLIETHVIDHYIPFLPLEKSHVEKCLKAEFKKWNLYPSKEAIEELMKEHIIYDRANQLFATSGCKTIEKKVAIYAYKTK